MTSSSILPRSMTDEQRHVDQQIRLEQAAFRREMDAALKEEKQMVPLVSNQSSQSEVAQLRQRIQMECEAMQQAMSGIASTAKHCVIDHKYASLETAHQRLTQIIGEQEATTILVDVYSQAVQ